jgi:teichuronic acid biosynthesis glycosyltransferase TuaG
VKFSILTATHNTEKYIIDAINSVLNQTYSDWEMIILDDCSKDKTYETALKFASDKLF